jgi:hypothetical protein
VEGVLMMLVGSFGVLLNIFAVCFFIRQRSQRTFHRSGHCCQLIWQDFPAELAERNSAAEETIRLLDKYSFFGVIDKIEIRFFQCHKEHCNNSRFSFGFKKEQYKNFFVYNDPFMESRPRPFFYQPLTFL